VICRTEHRVKNEKKEKEEREENNEKERDEKSSTHILKAYHDAGFLYLYLECLLHHSVSNIT
jgi:hypothetical protein